MIATLIEARTIAEVESGLPSIGSAFAGSQTGLDLIAVGYSLDLSASYAQ